MKVVKIAIAALTAVTWIQIGLAAQTIQLPLGGGDATRQASSDSDTVKVQGRGVGEDSTAALKDAYRDAIERAVGLYVDAEQVAQNDELVRNQILTQSNAYITDYRVLEERRIAGGLVQLRILATVKKQALTKKISDAMQPQVFALGNDAQNLHSQMTTVAKRGEDGAALLKNVLEGVNPVKQLVRLTLADPKPIRKKWGNTGGERTLFRFKFEVDEDKYYNEFLPPILKVLDQIAIEQPKDFRLSRCDGRNYYCSPSDHIENLAEGMAYLSGMFSVLGTGSNGGAYIHGPKEDYRDRDSLDKIKQELEAKIPSVSRKAGFRPFEFRLGDADEAGVYCDVSTLGNGNQDPWVLPNDSLDDMTVQEEVEKIGFVQVTVITKMNKEQTSITARRYKLPVNCLGVLWQWYKGIAARDAQTNYMISFSDGTDEEAAVSSVSFKNGLVVNVFMGVSNHHPGGDSIFPDYPRLSSYLYGMYITPMILTAAKSFQTWIPFDIPQDQLAQLRSIKISLEGGDMQNNQSKSSPAKRQGAECAALLRNALSCIDPVKQLLRFSLADPKLIRKKWCDRGERCLYRFKFEVDENKYYNDFLPPLLKVLDQIAIEQPKTFPLIRRWGNESDWSWMPKSMNEPGLAYFNGDFNVLYDDRIDESDLCSRGEKMLEKNWSPQVGVIPYMLHPDYGAEKNSYGVYCDVCVLGTGAKDENPWCPDNHRRFGDNRYRDLEQKCGFFQVTVITKMNKTRTSITAKSYKLPLECLDVVIEWYKKIGGNNSEIAKTNYVISFLDEGGEEVAGVPVSFNNATILNVFLGKNNALGYMKSSIFRDYPSEDDLLGMYVTPMINTTARSFETWIPFDIPQDQLPKIRSVKVELSE